MPPSCPFNSEAYLAGLPHLGRARSHPSAPAAVLERRIPGSSRSDGLGPWPYMWVDDASQIADFREAFDDLATLAVVTQPGYRPAASMGDPIHFKEHYIYDPERPFPELSKRSRTHLRRSSDTWQFDIVSDVPERLAIVGLYGELKRRRGLAGGFFDFPRIHFETLARLDGALFFRVSNGATVGAMACAVAFGDRIQMLHIAVSDAGLRADASYLLMDAVLRFARDQGRLLLMGGLPREGDAGLLRFKTRWSNRSEPAFLLRIVNDRAAYAALTRGVIGNTYFPAYRTAAWPNEARLAHRAPPVARPAPAAAPLPQ